MSCPPHTVFSLPIGERTWHIEAVKSQEALAERLEGFAHFPFGLLLWESAVALAHWIVENRSWLVGRSVLELGAGAGLPGLVAQSFGANVHQTDHLAEALTLAKANAQRNAIEGISYFLADWRVWSCTHQFDLLLGADILYDRNLHKELEEVFLRSLHPRGTLVLTDPGRQPAIEMMARLERAGWRVELGIRSVPPIRPEESDLVRPVEIGLWRARPPCT